MSSRREPPPRARAISRTSSARASRARGSRSRASGSRTPRSRTSSARPSRAMLQAGRTRSARALPVLSESFLGSLEVGDCILEVRLDPRGLLEMLYRLWNAVHLDQSHSQIIVSLGEVRSAAQRLLE